LFAPFLSVSKLPFLKSDYLYLSRSEFFTAKLANSANKVRQWLPTLALDPATQDQPIPPFMDDFLKAADTLRQWRINNVLTKEGETEAAGTSVVVPAPMVTPVVAPAPAAPMAPVFKGKTPVSSKKVRFHTLYFTWFLISSRPPLAPCPSPSAFAHLLSLSPPTFPAAWTNSPTPTLTWRGMGDTFLLLPPYFPFAFLVETCSQISRELVTTIRRSAQATRHTPRNAL
jgi:hypothetical protein